MSIRRNWFAIVFGIALFVFTGYLLADTFLIPHVYAVAETVSSNTAAAETMPSGATEKQQMTVIQTEVTGADPDLFSREPEAEEEPAENGPVLTDTSYTDGNIQVALTTYRLSDTTVYVADVQLSSSDYLKTAFADGIYGRNVTEKTSSIASSVGAVLAVNGDYYGAQRSGYVIRNGVLYRNSSGGGEDLVIYADGTFGIIDEDEISAEELLANGAWNVLSFGPALVQNGEITVTENEEVGKAMASNPRTAIGVIDDLHYVFVVADGRTNESSGLSLYELAQLMQQIGAKTAYNLDGGGSSSMVFLGNVINNPTSGGRGTGERSVSDIVYIGYGI